MNTYPLDGVEIALDDPRLESGFYAIERDEGADGGAHGWRWTDGDALLRVPGAGRLDITVHLFMSPWVPPDGESPGPASDQKRDAA